MININFFILYKIEYFVNDINGDDMEKEKYKKIVNKYKPKEDRLMNGIVAFVVGGFIGVVGQLLIEFYSEWLHISTQDASSFMIVTLIFISCLFTALGFFDKWVNFAKCGLIIPITGFAHSMMSSGLEYKHEGPIFGVGANLFKLAGSVILYGIVAACFFGMIRYCFLGGV